METNDIEFAIVIKGEIYHLSTAEGRAVVRAIYGKEQNGTQRFQAIRIADLINDRVLVGSQPG